MALRALITRVNELTLLVVTLAAQNVALRKEIHALRIAGFSAMHGRETGRMV